MKTRAYLFLALVSVFLSIPLLNAQTVTIDASRLTKIAQLEPSFRFHIGDDPRFANVDFDDTAWPLVKPGVSLATTRFFEVRPGYTWSRIHLHILNSTDRLVIAMDDSAHQPYEVFFNGRRVATSLSMQTKTPRYGKPYAFALPPMTDIVLSVRCLVTAATDRQPLPPARFRIGQLDSIESVTELERIRSFDNTTLPAILLALIYFAFFAVALTLFLAQRAQTEYLWLAVLCLLGSIYESVHTAIHTGVIPATPFTQMFSAWAGWAFLVSSLEFVIRFSRTKSSSPARMLQLIMLLCPLLNLFHFRRAYEISLISAFLVLLLFMSFYMVQAIRRGHAESWLLLPPFAFWALADMISIMTPAYSPVGRLFSGLQFGYIGVSYELLGGFVLVSGFLVVVLFRFIRVSRDEEHSASEIAAARAIQQLLIPDTLPSAPGLNIESAYLPADEVGGDFFQILPQASGTTLIFVGDVSGHGLRAAMTVSLLVGSIRALTDFLQSPAELLNHLNHDLVGRKAGFATCLVLAISSDGVLTFANAGHLNAYIDGNELESDPNLPLGLVRSTIYTEYSLRLNPRQRLTLLTDGVVESTGPKTKTLFGFDRAREISTRSAGQIAETARAFGLGSSQADDITVLTVEFVGK